MAGTATHQPTQHEQYMLQMINRARADGNAEMTRLGNASGVTVNEGPPSLSGNAWTIFNSVPPLAWNTQLTSAAQSHADNLQSVDWFFNTATYGGPHSVNSSFPGGASTANSRIAASGYVRTTSGVRTSGGLFPGAENVSVGWASPQNGWSNAERLAAINSAHEGLFEDFSVAGRGHRNTTMLEHFRDIGIGTAFGIDDGGTKDSFYFVQNFGKSSTQTNPILTGLAYNDLDNNNFFTPALTPTSESITGLTVQARQSGSVVASVAAFDTGGYSLPLAAGTYQIHFVKADGSEHSAGTVVMGADNVELNVKSPTFTTTFASWIAGFPGAAAQPGFTQDADADGVPNGVEHILGTSPAARTAGLTEISKPGNSLKFRHSRSNAIVAGITHTYQWSTDLSNWHSSGQTNAQGITATVAASSIVDNTAPNLDTVEVTTTITAGSNPPRFVRLRAAQ
jgi:uncharacterized protein YkwD